MRKILICVSVFLVSQALSPLILLNDYPKDSTVDISRLQEIGNARIDGFEEKQAALEETIYFIGKTEVSYSYRFTYYYERPSVRLTIYVLEDFDTAYKNLVVSSGGKEKQLQKLSETVYVYQSKSILLRDYKLKTDKNLQRSVNTHFIIDRYLFLLYEYGDAGNIGNTTNEIIDLIIETFIENG